MLEFLLIAMAVGGGLMLLLGIVMIVLAKMSDDNSINKVAIFLILFGIISLCVSIVRISHLHALIR